MPNNNKRQEGNVLDMLDVFALSAHRRTEACKRSLEYSMHRLVQIVDVFLPNEYHPDK